VQGNQNDDYRGDNEAYDDSAILKPNPNDFFLHAQHSFLYGIGGFRSLPGKVGLHSTSNPIGALEPLMIVAIRFLSSG
jgi:hypothetical protein